MMAYQIYFSFISALSLRTLGVYVVSLRNHFDFELYGGGELSQWQKTDKYKKSGPKSLVPVS